MILTYPSGATVRRLDYVWFDEGQTVGFIDRIYAIANPEESGYSEPSVIINLLDPGTALSIWMGYPYSCFADEGIDLLTDDETNRISCAKLHVATESGVAQSLMVAFVIHDPIGEEKFPLIVACYDVLREPLSAWKFLGPVDKMTHSRCDLSILPGYAWPIKGGGPAP